ncbi:thrombospondin type-1 domain-containing protein 4-like [Battus philenor]|uniref:thrombospondin type-1 domain-containing protein 4-like n=1 Tax=Battus philenor TaxID=42288 RepID=UPI0035D0FC45
MKMEHRRYLFWTNKSCWAAVIMQVATITMAANTAADSLQALEESLTSAYAWTSWGSWGPCSMTCGGGVAVQERECLPRTRSVIKNGSSLGSIRIQRADCPGVSRRYHECNTAPCTIGEQVQDVRADQCAAYDRRPFHGRFYNWVPYIDGNVPCRLNCRPIGQQFYASLGVVADGTPCTKPGFRAVCIQGNCKAVGRESVLARADSVEPRCGRRLVSGLFTRSRLPLGYSYVSTVPRGACRLNVTELVPSDNYIALKKTNGTYLINGEFAISSPGTYDAVGARFIYTRINGLDSVFTHGPIHYPIDIMILYTEPNPNIKYEYLTDYLPGELDVESITKSNFEEVQQTTTTRHTRKHHGYDSYPRFSINDKHPDVIGVSKEIPTSKKSLEENLVGTRRFLWKVTSYTQCSRSCGGGFQVGKYRCVEESSDEADKEISSVHCPGSVPPAKRRRCGLVACPPRWRTASWSTCPQCGPATRTRIVGCVQDHSRGITKVSDQRCPPPKPSTTEKCNVPNCSEYDTSEAKRVVRLREQTATFREGPVYTITVNSSDIDVGPEYSFSATAGWLSADWSECIGWCVGGGIQTRSVRCSDPSGCSPLKSPEASRNCTPSISCIPHEGRWFTGEWSPCSSKCGGKQIRGVLCIGGSGRHLRDSACKDAKPEHERDCIGDCTPVWYYSDWGQCVGNCTLRSGVQRRTVVCARGSNGANDGECEAPRPPAQRACDPNCSADTLDRIGLAESQKVEYEISSTQRITTEKTEQKDCVDKLSNCALAVQARLCHYKYYIQNCCNSCTSI